MSNLNGNNKQADMSEEIEEPHQPLPEKTIADLQFLANLHVQHISQTEGQNTGINMSEMLQSDDFLEKLHRIDSEKRMEVIGRLIEYSVLHPDGFMLGEALEEMGRITTDGPGRLNQGELAALYTHSILKKRNITDVQSNQAKNAVIDHCKEHIQKKGKFYHGFNGVFERSIREQGLKVEERSWDWDELKRIRQICEKAGHPMVFGWAHINSESKTSVSATASPTYRYAISSPEWFAQFTSEGFHVPFDSQKKTAYYRRDYETAKANVIALCDNMMSGSEEDIRARKAYPNITAEERLQIMEFFEKYWQKFTNEKSKPKAALVSKEAVHGRKYDDKLDAYFESLKIDDHAKNMKTEDLLWMISMSMTDDKQISHDILPEEITIIDLPDYEKVFP